jgi:hypothetical protein
MPCCVSMLFQKNQVLKIGFVLIINKLAFHGD